MAKRDERRRWGKRGDARAPIREERDGTGIAILPTTHAAGTTRFGTAAMIKDVVLAGRTFRVSGNPADGYFQNLESIASALAPVERWLRRNLPPDAVILDAGGNIGLTALLFSSLFPDGQVHVFEALPSNGLFLSDNIQQNGVRNCV